MTAAAASTAGDDADGGNFGREGERTYNASKCRTATREGDAFAARLSE